MSLIAWSDSLSVHVKDFDQEHRTLVELINRLHDAIRAGKGAQVVGEVVQSLERYTRTHFAHEERLRKQHGYPDWQAHRDQHEQLLRQVQDLAGRLRAGQNVLTLEIMDFLNRWLVGHIQGTDLQYGPFLNGKGVA